jgi:tripartite-type tricarboxylate transporter receptor subunit TctC
MLRVLRIFQMFFLAVLLLPASAFAQTSTQKSIRMIVPFAAGASADGIARAIAIDLGKRLGKTVVVENIVGAGGTTGLVALANAAPDGDTLGIGATGALVVQPHLPGPTAPDLLRRITPVAKLIEVGIVVVANPKVGPKSIAELIARSKENPQGISYGSTGVHTGQHLTMEMLARATGANLVHIPYRGSAPAIVDLVAGQIPVASVDITSAYPHIVAGRALALGMAEAKRSRAAPEIPTIGESGVLGFGRAGGFIGLFAPAGTPAPLVKRISDEVRQILASPAIAPNLKALTVSAAYEDEAAFAAFLATETGRWKQTLQSLKLAK